MGTWKRRTSCGQPQATAIFPAHIRAASSSATSTTVKPPRCSFVSANGPSVISGMPLDASTLNTGAASSRPPRKTKTPAAFISATSALTALDFSCSSSTVWSGTHSSLKLMRYSVMSPPLPGWPCGHLPPSRRMAAARFDTASGLGHPSPRTAVAAIRTLDCRSGRGRRRGELGQVEQRVGEVLRAERREPDAAVADELRHRRPVVAERDLSLGRTERRQVVTPDPAAELQATVALLLPRQPANGARRVEHLDLVHHLIVTVWMVGVIHVHPENLPHLGQRRPVSSFLNPAGAIDRSMRRRVRQHGEHPRGGPGDGQCGAHVLLVRGGLVGRGLRGSGADDGHRRPPVGDGRPVAGLSPWLRTGSRPFDTTAENS